MVVCQGVVVCQFPVYELSFCHIRHPSLAALSAVACEVSWLSAIKTVFLEGAALLWLLRLFLGLHHPVIDIWGWVSSVSPRCSGSTQVHGYRHIVKVSQGIGRVVALEPVLGGSWLALLLVEPSPIGDSSPSFLEHLLYGFLRCDTIDGSPLHDLVVVCGGWLEDVFANAFHQAFGK